MNRSKALSLPALLLAILVLASCSGPKGGVCTVNCGGGGGNGNVIVTVTSTPSQTFFFPYLEWAVISVDLIDSTGGVTNVIGGAPPPLEFAHLQTDSQFLGIGRSLPAKTYSSVRVSFKPSTTTSYFYNSSSATVLGCATATVCKIPSTVAGFVPTTITVPTSFSISANGSTGFSLNFDLSKAVTSAGGMTFDFTQGGAITVATLPRTGQMAGSLDSLENFTGEISAKTSTTIDMFSLSSDTRTFTVSTATFDDPFNVCKGSANISCLAVNQNVSVDAVVNSDGTLTAYEVEFLDPGPAVVQETEGIIVTPVSSSQFQMVVTSGMPVTGFLTGTLVTVNVNAASSPFVDPKNLVITTNPPTGFTSSTDLVVGQTVMLEGGSLDFTNNTLSGYTRTLLRYSSIGGTVTSPSGTILTLSGLSPFFSSSTTNTVQVQTFANTTYDNIAAFSGLVAGMNASVRGLYLNPNSGATQPLLAAKVRTH